MKPDVVSTPIVDDQSDETAITPQNGGGGRARSRKNEPKRNGSYEAVPQERDENEHQVDDAPVRHEQLLARLADLWKSRNHHDLESRREAGVLLNEELGSPEKRLPKGEQILEKAAGVLGSAQSEVNRMRWLAFIFETSEQLEGRTEITSWTAFKNLLPDLRAEKTGKPRRATPGRKKSTLKSVSRSIESLASKVAQVDAPPDAELRKELLGQLNRLADAATERLKIAVSVQAS